MNNSITLSTQRRVALVDDDAAVRDALRLLLQLAGHDVVAFASASALLDDRPAALDCLILDHHMRPITGLELAGHLRERGDTVRILLVTGAPSPAILKRAAELRIERVLEKPPSEDDLMRFIEGC